MSQDVVVDRCEKCPALCCTVAGEVDVTDVEADILSTVSGRPLEEIVMPVDDGKYILKKSTGLVCPFLTSDYKCGVYDHRPETCRKYTCKGDPVIYQLWRVHRYVRY